MRKARTFVSEEALDLRIGRKVHFVDREDIKKDEEKSRKDGNGDSLRGPKHRQPVRSLPRDP